MSKLSKEEAKQALESLKSLPESPWWDEIQDAVEVAIEALSEPKEPKPAELIPDERHKRVWCRFETLVGFTHPLHDIDSDGVFHDWDGDTWDSATISTDPVPVAKIPNPGYQPVDDDVLCVVFFRWGGRSVGLSKACYWAPIGSNSDITHYIPLDVRETD